MKLSLKSTLTLPSTLSIYEEDSYVFPIDNYICVNEIKQSACKYIPLGEKYIMFNLV